MAGCAPNCAKKGAPRECNEFEYKWGSGNHTETNVAPWQKSVSKTPVWRPVFDKIDSTCVCCWRTTLINTNKHEMGLFMTCVKCSNAPKYQNSHTTYNKTCFRVCFYRCPVLCKITPTAVFHTIYTMALWFKSTKATLRFRNSNLIL